jgi:hypothetical protein
MGGGFDGATDDVGSGGFVANEFEGVQSLLGADHDAATHF